MSIKTLIVQGCAIHDIASFYDEMNRVFMEGEDWQLGHSLDALDDMLYGGYGAINGAEPIVLIWHDIEQSRKALGTDATRAFYLAKLARPDVFNTDQIRRDLDRLNSGEGPTFFDIVLEIIASHSNIELRDHV